MVYNGKESVEVEKDVQSVRTVNDGKGLLLLMDMDDNGNYTLTYADSKLNTTEIDDDVRVRRRGDIRDGHREAS